MNSPAFIAPVPNQLRNGMKVLVHILGPGASGKSTLTRKILEDPSTAEVSTTVQALDQRRGVTRAEKVTYTLSANGIALAGNWKSGSDSIETIDALTQAIELCWKQRDTVIVDSVRCSKKFVNWMRNYPEPLAALFIYLDTSLEETIRRLLARRRDNVLKKGELPEEALPEKTYENVLAFRDRAKNVWTHAYNNYDRFPRQFLVIPERLSPAESATAARNALEKLRSEIQATEDKALEAILTP